MARALLRLVPLTACALAMGLTTPAPAAAEGAHAAPASARALAHGVRRGTRAPRLVLASAPKRRTASRTAAFTYRASAGRVSCTLDGARHRCKARRTRVTTRPGRHVLRVRASTKRGTSTVSWSWTVVAPAPAAAPDVRRGTAPTPPPVPADWRLLLADDFDGTSLDTSTWLAYGPNWPGNGGNGIRDGGAVSVGGGVLTITAQMQGGSLVSGAVASYLNFVHGRVEFRVRTDADPSEATSGVVLLWPQRDEDWPAESEYDIYETGTRPTRSQFDSFLHYGADNRQHQLGHPADATQWHDMAMDWTPSGITIYRDGELVDTIADPEAISGTPHHVCIQLDAFRQLMGAPVTMQVDHLRVYGSGT